MMRRAAPIAVLTLFALAALNAWLLIEVLLNGEARSQSPVVAATWTPDLPQMTEKPLRKQSISSYSATLAQPLFFKSRQPYVPPPPPVQPTPKPVATPSSAPADPGLVLGGIAIAEDGKWAYVFKRADLEGAWVKEGDTIAGWRLEAIDVASARLHQSGVSTLLQLYPEPKRIDAAPKRKP